MTTPKRKAPIPRADMVGIPKDVALPAAIVSHVFSQVPFILWGGWVLVKGGRGLIRNVIAGRG